MSKTYYFPPEQLRRAIYDLLIASGSPHEEADLVAERLVKSNLTGHPSHGVIRMPIYMQRVREGAIKPGAKPDIFLDHGSIVVINGNWAYGQVAAEKAMDIAIERARAHGIAAVGVTKLNHVGRLADYAISAARADCIGMVFTACGGALSLVAPFEGSSRRMATDPMAMGMPSDRDYPIVFDMATSVFAEGKLKVMLDTGRPAPDHTLIDKEGRSTTNPADFYEGGAILPLGGSQGYKGYLLNFMVEVLAGLLTGGGYLGIGEKATLNNCTLMIVIDVVRFRELSEFKRELEEMIKYLKESPAHKGKEVLYPGELEARSEADLLNSGIPLPAKTVETIQEELDHHNISLQLTEVGQLSPLNTNKCINI